MKDAIEFAGLLQLAVKALQFYSPDHPQSRQALIGLERAAVRLLGSHSRITLTLAHGKLLVDGHPVETSSPQVRKLSDQFEHQGVSGIVMMEGVSSSDLLEVVKILVMKTELIKEAGGTQKILDRAGVVHARLSQLRYEAVTEGEEVVWSKSVRRVDDIDQPHTLPEILRRFLSRQIGAGSSFAPETGGGSGSPTPTSNEIAQMQDAIVLGMQADHIGATSVSAGRELLREAIADIEPEIQLALLLSINRLPDGELRNILKSAASELTPQVMAAGLGSGSGGAGSYGDSHGETESSAPGASDFFSRLLGVLPETDRGLQLLKDRLQDLGVSREQLGDVLDVMTWDPLSTNEKLQKLSEGQWLFHLPAGKFVAFVRTLLEEGRNHDAFTLITRYSAGLTDASAETREIAFETMGKIAGFMHTPGTGSEIDHVLLKEVFTNMLQEPERHVQLYAVEAAAVVIGGFVATGRVAIAHANLTRAGAALASNPKWREAYMAFVRAVAAPDRMAELTDQMFFTDSDKFAAEVLPYITFLGAPITRSLVEALREEEDRNRRGRLVRALKSIGKPAYLALVEALQSDTWFVVRNVLNVLGDIGAPELVRNIGSGLHHPDPRVRRAAARALGKIRGDEAEHLLVGALGEKDKETQHEIFLCLGAMHAQTAVLPLIEMARPKMLGGDDGMRELVITTLGQIGSPAAVPILFDVASKRTAFSREPPTLRIAAAKALAAIGSAEADDALQKVIASESHAELKSQLQGFAKVRPRSL